MLGIGELVLLFLVFLFTGGALSRLAGWAFFRRAPGARQILSVLLDRVKGRRSAYPLASAVINILSGSPKSIDESPSRTEAGEKRRATNDAQGTLTPSVLPRSGTILPQLLEEVRDHGGVVKAR